MAFLDNTGLERLWIHICAKFDGLIGKAGTGTGSEIFNSYTDNVASGEYSHAEGVSTEASGNYSHAEGKGTIAASSWQHVQGKYNISNNANIYSHIVGNGTSITNRSNAHTLDWDGNAWFNGDVYVGGTSQSDAIKLPRITTGTAEPPSSGDAGSIYIQYTE